MDAHIGNDGKKKVRFPLENLKKHFVALGSSGSGKTVLSKVIVEEAALNGIPSILVDPQGDLASLMIPGTQSDIKKHGLDQDKYDALKKDVKVVVYTPMSSKGIPICINPLKLDVKKASPEEIIPLINEIAVSIAKLLGYDMNNDKGKAASAILYTILKDSYERNKPIGTFSNLAFVLKNLTESLRDEISSFTVSENDIDVLIRKVKFLTVGQKEMMFQFGVPLDVDLLLGKGKDKTQISVIYLNTLPSQDEKEFFISILSTNIYQWMLQNPSDKLQFLYYIDEIAPYIPAGSEKPMPKPILMLLFKQSRKYGIGCMVATQNPGDIDYKAFAQFGSWAIGRLTVKQDQKKIENALKSLSSVDISSELPKLTPGQFLLFSPDTSEQIQRFKARWLYSAHKTLNDLSVKKAMPQSLRDEFSRFELKAVKAVQKESIDEGLKKEKKTEPEQTDGPLHFPLLHDEPKIRGLIEKYKKKHLLIGPSKEELGSYTLTLHPLYKVRVAQNMAKWGVRKEQRLYDLLFDAVNGKVVTKKNAAAFVFHDAFRDMQELNETQLQIMKLLLDRATPISVADIALRTKISQTAVKRALTGMQKKKVASFDKQGKHQMWFSTIVKPSLSLQQLSSSLPELTRKDIDAKILNAKVRTKQISLIVKMMFTDAFVAETDLIYLPIHTIEYTSPKGTRRIFVNGYTAKIINP